MADAADFVLAVYNEHMAQARWHEEQREKVSALAFAGSSVLLTLGANGSQGQRYLAHALVVGLGLLGATIALKHYERNRRHVRLGRSLRQRLDLLLPDASVGSILQVIPTLESGACRFIEGIRLYVLWITLNLFNASLGAAMLVLSALQV
jgi:hypothetical protein